MPTLENLRLRTGQAITETWYDNLVDILESLAFQNPIDIYGYVIKDLVPYSDLALNLGIDVKRFKEAHVGYGYFTYDVWIGNKTIQQLIEEKAPSGYGYWYGGYISQFIAPDVDLALNLGFHDRRWKEVHGGWGYFEYGIFPEPKAAWYGGQVTESVYPDQDLALNLGYPNAKWKEVHFGYGYASSNIYVSGKAVIKDGDPVTVSDFGTDAENDIKNKVQEGIDASTDVESIKADISTLKDSFKPILLDKKWNISVNENTDIFSPDLVVSYGGRVRIKYMALDYSYLYLKHKASGETSFIEAMLNAGVAIPAQCWHEWDFTAMSNDQINLKISPSSTITVLVYNIPNA